MNAILEVLGGGDLRSEGRAAEVAAEIIATPALLGDLATGLQHADKLIRARTCMTLEVVSRDHSELLGDLVPRLIELAAVETVPQARWHLAEIFAAVPVSEANAEWVIPILLAYLDDKSKIVKYCAVQALGVLGRGSPARETIVKRISELKNSSKSMAKIAAAALQDLGGA